MAPPVQLGDREMPLFRHSKAPTRPPDLGFPLLPLPDCQAPSFKSVTNADLEPPFHRPWNGGLCFLGPGTFPSRHRRSEEHTSELQSLMRISYAVFCLKKKNINTKTQ